MKFRFTFFAVVSISVLLCSCAGSPSKEVTINLEENNSNVPVEKDSVDLSDVPLPVLNQPKLTFGEKPPDKTVVLPDKSELVTLHDGYGNTIETRTFSNSPNIAMIIAKTTADGKKEAVVYGYNGERKTLPISFVERAMTESSAKIAVMAGIVSERRPRIESAAENAAATESTKKSAPAKSEFHSGENKTNESESSPTREQRAATTKQPET